MARCTFLSLPLEVRQPILLYALRDESAKLDLRCGKGTKTQRTKRCRLMYQDQDIATNFALPCTCRQLRHEIQAIFESQLSVHLHVRQGDERRHMYSGQHVAGTMVARIRHFVIYDRDNWASVWWRFLADFPRKDLISLRVPSNLPASAFTSDHRKSFQAVDIECKTTKERVEKHAAAYFKDKKARVWGLKERRVPLEVIRQIGCWDPPTPGDSTNNQFVWVSRSH